MNMLKLLLAFSLSLSNSYVYAEIMALGNSDKIEDFKDHLESHPEDQSLKDTLILKSIQKSDELIESKYALAIKGLMMSDLKPSIYLFKEISSYPKSGLIFSDEKLKLLHESFYRLSNLDRTNALYWIKKGILSSPEYSPSEDIFNPSIIAKHEKTVNELKPYFYKLSVLDFTPKWATTYVDAKLQDGVFKVYPQANYTVKIFKDGHYPYEKSILGESLIKLSSIELKKIDLGNCKNPAFKNIAGQNIDKIFFSKNCMVNKKDVENRLAKSSEVNIYPAASQSSLLNKNIKEQNLDTKINTEKPSIFSKRKTWYYVIGAVALTSLAISLTSSDGPARIKPVQHDQN